MSNGDLAARLADQRVPPSGGTPGPRAAALLAAIDPSRCDDAERVRLLQAWERQANWVAAMQNEVLASFDDPPAADPGAQDWLDLEVGAALRLAPVTARRRIEVARALGSRCRATAVRLRSGVISALQARCLTEETERLGDVAVRAVDDRVLPRAGGQSLAQFRRSVRRAVLAVDPPAAEQAHEQALERRYLRCWPIEDGMAQLDAVLSAEDAAAVMGRVQREADRHPTGTAEVRRVDALVALVLNGSGPTRAGAPESSDSDSRARPMCTVIVRAETLAGLDDEPAELAGFGPITAQAARRIGAVADWRRAVVEPATGTLLDLGRSSYRPSAALARFVVARDQRCTFPFCGVPADRCDLDHAVPFADGGATDAANLGALCRHHHRARHRGGWQLRRDDAGIATWTSPAGHTYRTPPPSYP